MRRSAKKNNRRGRFSTLGVDGWWAGHSQPREKFRRSGSRSIHSGVNNTFLSNTASEATDRGVRQRCHATPLSSVRTGGHAIAPCSQRYTTGSGLILQHRNRGQASCPVGPAGAPEKQKTKAHLQVQANLVRPAVHRRALNHGCVARGVVLHLADRLQKCDGSKKRKGRSSVQRNDERLSAPLVHGRSINQETSVENKERHGGDFSLATTGALGPFWLSPTNYPGARSTEQRWPC